MNSTEVHENNKHQLSEHLELSETSQFKPLTKGFLFEEFVEGTSNKLAYEACKAIVDALGDSKHNPLFLYGASSLGKTHLMQAVGHAVFHKEPNATVMYLSASEIVTEFADTSQLQRVDQLRANYRNIDLLLIDDFELLAGKSSAFDAFFKIINDLSKESKQIVIASNLYPNEISAVDANLLSKLPSTLFIEVEPPELENRVDILLRYAKQHHYELPDDFALCIARKVIGNVKELETALDQVIAAAKLQSIEINIGLIKETLKDQFKLRIKIV